MHEIDRLVHLSRFVALQAQYSLLVRDLEREHVPACRQFGIGILPWAPLAAGFLSGKYRRDEVPAAGTRLERWKDRFAMHDNERGWGTLELVNSIAKQYDTTPAAVSLAWLLAKPQVSSVIFGARSVVQVDDNLRAADLKLTADEVAKLDAASAFELGYPYQFIANVQKRW